MASSPPGIIITLVEKVDQESETWALVLTVPSYFLFGTQCSICTGEGLTVIISEALPTLSILETRGWKGVHQM